MTAPSAPQAPTGPQQAYQRPQGPPPPTQQQQFVQQGQPQGPPPLNYQGPPQAYWTPIASPPSLTIHLSVLNWLAVVLLPLGLLVGIIVQATGAGTSFANIFALLGNAAVLVGGLALVGGLIVSALNKKD